MSENTKTKKSVLQEFKEFITRGNVIDLAVGVIIGGAFTAIVTALTSQILQPLINWLISLIGGNKGLESARTILGAEVLMDDGTGKMIIDWSKTNYIDWGAFISAVINFLLVAIILFVIVKTINGVRSTGETAKAKLLAGKKEEKATEENK